MNKRPKMNAMSAEINIWMSANCRGTKVYGVLTHDTLSKHYVQTAPDQSSLLLTLLLTSPDVFVVIDYKSRLF